MASLVRRAASRALLAGGIALAAMYAVRDCSEPHDEITIVVDPRPLGDTISAIRVDLFDQQGGERGNLEARYAPGEARTPVRLRVPAPGAGAELRIELDTADGLRRVRRTVDAPAGSTVRVRLGVGDPGDGAITP